MDSSKFADPAFEKGNHMDWLATMTVRENGLQAAIATDARNNLDDKTHASLQGGTLAPRNGWIDPTAAPIIDPNYYATETDRHFMRQSWRTISRLMLETPEGKDLVAEEILPEAHKCLQSDASNQDIDARIKVGGVSCYHHAGSCSMGTVVDSSCKVYGLQGLGVVDASIIPVPLAAHYQAPIFTLAEQAADIIITDHEYR
ncbi:MAG: hypothetical protein Q9228_003032 [Teloschistes exilis]